MTLPASSWLQRLSLLTSPPDASIPAGGRSKTRWPLSNSAICNPSLSPCCGWWSRLGQNAGAQVLLGLMLLGVSAETQAQTSITITSTRTSGPESHSLQQVNASHSISDWDGEGTYKFSWCMDKTADLSGGTATYNQNGPDYGISFRDKGNREQLSNNCIDSSSDSGATKVMYLRIDDDAIDEPDETIALRYVLSEGLTGSEAFQYTIKDNDPTIVSLAKVGSATAINEGDKVEFTVTLGRALVAGEIIEVPLSIGGTNVTTGDWSLARKSGASLNTGVFLSGATTATPKLTFTGTGSQTATLELTATADGDSTELPELVRIALGPDGSGENGFDSFTNTNVGGGADPHSTKNHFDIGVGAQTTAKMSLSASNFRNKESAYFKSGSINVHVSPKQTTGTPFKICFTSSLSNSRFLVYRTDDKKGLEEDWAEKGIFKRIYLDNQGCHTRTGHIPKGNHTNQTSFHVYGYGDLLDEPDEVVTATVSEDPNNLLPGGVTISSTANTATVTIRDNDPTIVSLAKVGVRHAINEGGKVEFTVTLGRALTAGEIIDVPLSIGGTNVTTGDWSLARKSGSSLNIGVALSGATTATPKLTFSGAGSQTATLELTATTDRGSIELPKIVRIALGPDGRGMHSFDSYFVATNVGGGADPHSTNNHFDIRIDDPEYISPVITITSGSAVTEGTEASFTVNANPAPILTLDVTVAVTQSGAFVTDGNLGSKTVTIPATQTSKTYTVATINDTIDEPNGSVTMTVNNDLPYTVGSTAAATITVNDNDTAAVIINESGGSISSVNEGHTDTYTVKLASLPAASVHIALASDDTKVATVSPATLRFTTSNWNTAQTVTFIGVDDSLDQDGNRRATISHSATSSDAKYNNIPIRDVTATVVDNDRSAVIINESGNIFVNEAAGAGRTDTYTVRLTTLPAASVSIAVTSDDTKAATVSPATLHFTATNWNTGQTVTVTAVDDLVDQGDSQRRVTISHSATSADAKYNNILIRDVTAIVVDNDGAGITIDESSGSTSVSEASGGSRTDTYTVALNSRPTASVTIGVESGATGAATINPATLTFSPSSWNTAQTVTITAVDDLVDQGDSRRVTISHTVTSSDVEYSNIPIRDVTATVADNDTAGVRIIQSGGTTSVSEASGGSRTDTYTMALNSRPTASVTIGVESGATGAATINPATLTFAPSNWNTAQTVTVTAVDDLVDQGGSRRVTISHSATSSDGNYNNISIPRLTATVVDNDGAGATISESSGSTSVTEAAGAGHTDTYTVVLNSQPTAPVSIAVTSDTTTAATVSPATLIFTPSNWSTAQTVTVIAVDDNGAQSSSRRVTISHSATSSDGNYNNISIPRLTATVVDNDGAGATISESSGSTSVTEAAGAGHTDTYTVVLNSQPTAPVSIAVTSDTTTAATVSPATLIFTPSNWSTAQTVTVTAVDDNEAQSSDRSVTISHTATSSDANYRTISIPSVAATVADNDTAVVTITESGGIFTVTVTPAPGVGSTMRVTFTVTGQPFRKRSSGGALVSTHSVTIDDSGTAHFILSTLDNSLYEGKGKITATMDAGAGYRPHPHHGAASVTVVDGHPGLMVSADSLRVQEGGSASYAMALATEPMGEVTVSISGGEGSSVTVSPTRLLFSPTTWNRPQSVGVRAVGGPSPAMGVPVTLSHRASGADYDGLTADVVVNVPADPVEKKAKKGWHLRLGRTVSHQVVDILQDRFAAGPTAGLQVTVAGEAITSAPPLAENEGLLSKALGFEAVSPEALAEGSSFTFAPEPEGEGATPQLALWGQGVFSSFRGDEEDALPLDGDVTTLLLGADWTGRRWQAGAALSQSWGHGSYGEDNDRQGEINSTVTGLFPYGRYAPTPRLGLWATAGHGWGQLTLKPDDTEDEYKPSTTIGMVAVGMDGLLLDGGSEGITLSTTADVLTLKTTSAEVDGLESSEGSLSRRRVGLEAVRPFPFVNGASLLPTMALGIRHDSGDAESGFGMDLGAGIRWSSPERGISGELKGHTLLTHTEEDFQEQGLALSFSWEPNSSNRGPSLSMGHTMGATPSGGMDALLEPATMQGLDTAPSSSGRRFEAELAYGFPAYDDQLTFTPAVGLAFSSTSRTYSLLWSLAPYSPQAQAGAWELSLEGEWQEQISPSSPVDHSLKLHFSLLL